MNFNWEKFEKDIKDIGMGEKVTADIDAKYASLVNDFTKEKFPEWQERLGPIVRDIINSHRDDPEAAAEALILVVLQMVHQLAQHEVLLEYVENYNAKMLEKFRAMDDRTTALIQVLVEKGIISEKDFGTK